jgi:hypothetical protein
LHAASYKLLLFGRPGKRDQGARPAGNNLRNFVETSGPNESRMAQRRISLLNRFRKTPRFLEIGLRGLAPDHIGEGRISDPARDCCVEVAFEPEESFENGTKWLQQHRDLLMSLGHRNSPQFAGCLSQWVDTGWGEADMLKKLLNRFSLSYRATLPLRDYVHLRLAEGLVASNEEETEKAIHHFDFIILVGEEGADGHLLALAHFWKGRCHRKLGEYENAMIHTVQAKELVLSQGIFAPLRS